MKMKINTETIEELIKNNPDKVFEDSIIFRDILLVFIFFGNDFMP